MCQSGCEVPSSFENGGKKRKRFNVKRSKIVERKLSRSLLPGERWSWQIQRMMEMILKGSSPLTWFSTRLPSKSRYTQIQRFLLWRTSLMGKNEIRFKLQLQWDNLRLWTDGYGEDTYDGGQSWATSWARNHPKDVWACLSCDRGHTQYLIPGAGFLFGTLQRRNPRPS